jgi:hypothetical protein
MLINEHIFSLGEATDPSSQPSYLPVTLGSWLSLECTTLLSPFSLSVLELGSQFSERAGIQARKVLTYTNNVKK